MKKNKRILAVLVASAFTSLSVSAQILPSNEGNGLPINAPVKVGQGNVYEKEVTPLLRDISKKKSLLELRKLDRELEKLEEETLTAQIERDKALNPPAPLNVTSGSANFGQALPQMPSNVPPAPIATVSNSPETRVLMVYGFDNDLYAKVSHGMQGGYIVKKGDVLPDGRLVTNVTSNFIEVQKVQKVKKSSTSGKNEKLFVVGPAPVVVGGASGSNSGSNSLPSSNPFIATGSGSNGVPIGPGSPLPFGPTTSNSISIPNGMGSRLPSPGGK